MARKKPPVVPEENNPSLENFKLNRAKIKEMYESDRGTKNAVGRSPSSDSVDIKNLTVDGFNSKYYNLASLDEQRKLSDAAYKLYPVYASVIDYLSNMFTWDYVY